jgi:hypothetical protein
MLGRLGDAHRVRSCGITVGQGTDELACVGHDHREGVVEIVGDPPGQAAERIQAVGLTQLLVHAFTFLIGQDPAGDVAQDAFDGDDPAAVIADGDRALLGPGDAAVRLPPARDQRGRLGRAPGCLDRAAVLRFHRREHQSRVAVQVLGSVAGEAGHGGAYVLETRLGDQPVAEDDVLDVLGQQPEAFFAGQQGGLGAVPLPAYLGVTQLSFHGRDEPGQAVLEYEVLDSCLHDLGRGLLAHCPGDHDERHVEVAVPQHPQGVKRAEPGQVVVADDEIRRPGRQCLGYRRQGFRALVGQLDAAAAQVGDDQQGVVVAVIDDQQANRRYAQPLVTH